MRGRRPTATTTRSKAILAAVGEMRDAVRLGPREGRDGDALDHRDAIGGQHRAHRCAHLFVLARNEARRALDEGRRAAEPGEALREFAADRAAADDQQPRGALGQAPQRFRGQRRDVGEAGDRRQDRLGAGRHDDASAGQAAPVDLDRPGIEEARAA